MKELIAGILYANDDYIFYKSPYGEYWIQMRIHYGERKESDR